MRAFAVIALLATSARAQSLPGTADDPAAALHIVPSVVDAPLQQLAVRGGTAEDTAIYVDGFEIPRLSHVLGLRAVIPADMLANGFLATAPDVSVARSSAVILSLEPTHPASTLAASTYDVALGAHNGAIRASVLQPILDAGYFDGQLRLQQAIGPRWRLDVSLVGALDQTKRSTLVDEELHEQVTRLIVAATWAHGGWAATVAAATLLDDETIKRDDRHDSQHLDHSIITGDTRADVVRSWPTALGLSNVEWRFGEQTNIAHHDLDLAWPRLPREGSPQPEHAAPEDTTTRFTGTLWTPDAALFSSVSANLGRDIRATTGLRLDYFGRGHDLATQPRGELLVDVAPQTRLGLAAGAYRRTPEATEELTTTLNPERTTQVMARVEHRHQALTLQASTYYAQRSRLVIRDDEGVLRNTGLGTAYGVEVSAQLKIRRLFIWATGALSRSLRQDFLFGRERPSELDQPLRATALASYRTGPWRIGGRIQIASGLPTTAIQRAIYDADTDVFKPIYAENYGERLPTRYELDLRLDRTIRASRMQLDAFADIALSPSTIDYRYSVDYSQRERVRIPIAPYVGLRGTL